MARKEDEPKRLPVLWSAQRALHRATAERLLSVLHPAQGSAALSGREQARRGVLQAEAAGPDLRGIPQPLRRRQGTGGDLFRREPPHLRTEGRLAPPPPHGMAAGTNDDRLRGDLRGTVALVAGSDPGPDSCWRRSSLGAGTGRHCRQRLSRAALREPEPELPQLHRPDHPGQPGTDGRGGTQVDRGRYQEPARCRGARRSWPPGRGRTQTPRVTLCPEHPRSAGAEELESGAQSR